MLRDMLEFFQEQFDRTEWDLCDEGSHPNRLMFVNKLTGDVKFIEDEPQAIRIEAHSLDAFCELEAAHSDSGGQVFVCSEGIVAVLDAGSKHPRNFVWLKLHEHTAIKELYSGQSTVPKNVARWCDVALSDCNLSPPDFPDALREVKFSSSEDKAVKTQHGDEGLSIEVKKKVSGATSIPKRLEVAFQLYPHLGVHFKHAANIKCDVYIDVDAGRVNVCPLPGEISSARGQAVELLVQEIRRRLDAKSGEDASDVYAGEWVSFGSF